MKDQQDIIADMVEQSAFESKASLGREEVPKGCSLTTIRATRAVDNPERSWRPLAAFYSFIVAIKSFTSTLPYLILVQTDKEKLKKAIASIAIRLTAYKTVKLTLPHTRQLVPPSSTRRTGCLLVLTHICLSALSRPRCRACIIAMAVSLCVVGRLLVKATMTTSPVSMVEVL